MANGVLVARECELDPNGIKPTRTPFATTSDENQNLPRLLASLLVASAIADGGNRRQNRRFRGSRLGRAGGGFRSGRQEANAAVAPVSAYGAAVPLPSAPAPIDDYVSDYVDSDVEDYDTPVPALGQYASGNGNGYYADPEAQCQVFHICTADGFGGLAKYSFLCPNGTTFNQNYFICDWWFNFDCAEAESLYSRNDEIRAEQVANIGAVAPEGGNAAITADFGAYDNLADYDDYDLGATDLPATIAPLASYAADALAPVFDDNSLSDPVLGSYGSPAAAAEEERAARRFRAGRGRVRVNNQSRSRSGRRFNNQQANSRQQSRRGRQFRG
eukprot:snap_masked-scaffold374_size191929-processed-gene-0.12 protein:Tk01258 transcript:snap_masked-scaffold374_size191929-processed-gene-0.12-mRNA-1 annotation:"conserved hypothetical protein"